MLSLTGEYFGGGVTKKTATLDAQNTWLPTFTAPSGPAGAVFVLPIRINVLTGAPVVTIQAKGSDEADTEWLDYMDTAGSVNGGLLLKYVDMVPVTSGYDYRVGVKTGAIGGGSVKITYGQ